MGNYLDIQKFKKWLQNNYRSQERTNKHEVWILQVFDEENNGKILSFENWTFSFHRTNGQGVSNKDISEVSKKMKLKKSDLIEMVRNKKNLDIEHFRK